MTIVRGDTVIYQSQYNNQGKPARGLVTHVNADGTATVHYVSDRGSDCIAFGVPADQLTARYI